MRTIAERRPPLLAWRVALAAAVLIAWEWGAPRPILDPFFFSRPSEIVLRVGQWTASAPFWRHVATTFTEAALAFAIGGTAGVLAGFTLARMPLLALLLDPYIRILNALPRVVLAPMFLLWFGLGIWSKVALGVTVVFFVVFFNTYRGIREVDAVVLNNARMLGASERQLIRHVLIPSALTWIFSSLHISIGFAIIAVVVGEYLGSSRGIGYMISQAEGVFDTTGVFAGMAILAGVVLVVGALVDRLEGYLLRWKARDADAMRSNV